MEELEAVDEGEDKNGEVKLENQLPPAVAVVDVAGLLGRMDELLGIIVVGEVLLTEAAAVDVEKGCRFKVDSSSEPSPQGSSSSSRATVRVSLGPAVRWFISNRDSCFVVEAVE